MRTETSRNKFKFLPSFYNNLRQDLSKVAYIVASCALAGIRGGNANNAANDGLGNLNVNNAVGNANVNYSGRFSEKSFYSQKRIKNTQYIVHHRTVGGLITS